LRQPFFLRYGRCQVLCALLRVLFYPCKSDSFFVIPEGNLSVAQGYALRCFKTRHGGVTKDERA